MTRLDTKLVAVALCATAGCVARASLGPTLGPPPPPPPEGAVVAGGPGGPIEAGCSFNATQIQPEMGDTVQVSCPPGCPPYISIWGTDVYTADSSICVAAVHAGAAPPSGGVVLVHLEPGRPAYRGSARHGVESSDYGSYGASYRFAR